MKSTIKISNYERYYKDFVPDLKKEKNQKYIMVILTLSASIFFLIFAINPTITTIFKLRKQISDARLVEEKLSQKIINLSSLSQEYQKIQNDIPIIKDAIPDNPRAPELVGQIQTIGKNSNVEITNIKIYPVNLILATSTQSSSFSFELSANSNFENMQKFLTDLTTMQRALALNTLQIYKNEDEENNINYSLKGKAYIKK